MMALTRSVNCGFDVAVGDQDVDLVFLDNFEVTIHKHRLMRRDDVEVFQIGLASS